MVKGKDIRKKALVLARKHWLKISCVALGYAVGFSIIQWLLPQGIIKNIVANLIVVLVYPFYGVPLNRMLIAIWRERKDVKWDWLFCFRVSAMWKAAMVVAVLNCLIGYLSIPNDLVSKSSPFWVILFISLSLAAGAVSCLRFWLRERLLLTPYLLATGYSTSPLELCKKSFRDMKGNIWAHITFSIATCWWIILLCVILALLVLKWQEYSAQILCCTLLLSAVYSPYVLLCNVGFIQELLPSDKELKKINSTKALSKR